jgi:hypothetical protein
MGSYIGDRVVKLYYYTPWARIRLFSDVVERNGEYVWYTYVAKPNKTDSLEYKRKRFRICWRSIGDKGTD